MRGDFFVAFISLCSRTTVSSHRLKTTSNVAEDISTPFHFAQYEKIKQSSPLGIKGAGSLLLPVPFVFPNITLNNPSEYSPFIFRLT